MNSVHRIRNKVKIFFFCPKTAQNSMNMYLDSDEYKSSSHCILPLVLPSLSFIHGSVCDDSEDMIYGY